MAAKYNLTPRQLEEFPALADAVAFMSSPPPNNTRSTEQVLAIHKRAQTILSRLRAVSPELYGKQLLLNEIRQRELLCHSLLPVSQRPVIIHAKTSKTPEVSIDASDSFLREPLVVHVHQPPKPGERRSLSLIRAKGSPSRSPSNRGGSPSKSPRSRIGGGSVRRSTSYLGKSSPRALVPISTSPSSSLFLSSSSYPVFASSSISFPLPSCCCSSSFSSLPTSSFQHSSPFASSSYPPALLPAPCSLSTSSSASYPPNSSSSSSSCSPWHTSVRPSRSFAGPSFENNLRAASVQTTFYPVLRPIASSSTSNSSSSSTDEPPFPLILTTSNSLPFPSSSSSSSTSDSDLDSPAAACHHPIAFSVSSPSSHSSLPTTSSPILGARSPRLMLPSGARVLAPSTSFFSEPCGSSSAGASSFGAVPSSPSSASYSASMSMASPPPQFVSCRSSFSSAVSTCAPLQLQNTTVPSTVVTTGSPQSLPPSPSLSPLPRVLSDSRHGADDEVSATVHSQPFPPLHEYLSDSANTKYAGPLIDRFGGIHDSFTVPTMAERKLLNFSRAKEKEREAKWTWMLENWDYVQQKRKNLLRRRVRKGVPNTMRGKVWPKLSAAQPRPGWIGAHSMQEYKLEDEILRDIGRTFPTNVMYRDGYKGAAESRGKLFNVLKMYAILDPEVGYCQGMGFLVGIFLMYMGVEDSLWMLESVLRGKKWQLHGLYSQGFPLLQENFYILEQLIARKCPALHRHFTRIGVESNQYATEWFMTFFAFRLPFELLLRMWDVLFHQGMRIIFSVGIYLLKCNQKILLSYDFPDIVHCLKNLHEKQITDYNVNAVMTACFKLRITNKLITRLSEEYRKKSTS